MPGISLLVFSRDDVDDAVELVKSLYDSVDDILVVDSSKKAEHARLLRIKKELRLRKMNVDYVVALAYSELYRPYAFGKCKNEWVLFVDTDERISPGLKSQLHTLVADKQVCGYYIKRYERAYVDKFQNNFFTWQLRLFRKSLMTVRGFMHETPGITGRTARIEDSMAYMMHREDLKLKHGYRNYDKMYVFESDPAYKLIMRNFYLAFKLRGLSSFTVFKNAITDVMRYRKDRTPEIAAIGRMIAREGMIKYLGLDRKGAIQRLTTKYRNGKIQGVELLMQLLIERYRTGKRP